MLSFLGDSRCKLWPSVHTRIEEWPECMINVFDGVSRQELWQDSSISRGEKFEKGKQLTWRAKDF